MPAHSSGRFASLSTRRNGSSVARLLHRTPSRRESTLHIMPVEARALRRWNRARGGVGRPGTGDGTTPRTALSRRGTRTRSGSRVSVRVGRGRLPPTLSLHLVPRRGFGGAQGSRRRRRPGDLRGAAPTPPRLLPPLQRADVAARHRTAGRSTLPSSNPAGPNRTVYRRSPSLGTVDALRGVQGRQAQGARLARGGVGDASARAAPGILARRGRRAERPGGRATLGQQAQHRVLAATTRAGSGEDTAARGPRRWAPAPPP